MPNPVDVSDASLDDLAGWMAAAHPPATWRKLPVPVRAVRMRVPFRVRTVDGNLAEGRAGDYLCVGPAGDRYPCRREVFEATYEPAPTPRSDWSEELVGDGHGEPLPPYPHAGYWPSPGPHEGVSAGGATDA